EVTPEMQAEIDRRVAAGRALGRFSGRATPEQLAPSLVRRADFQGQGDWLGAGWTEDTEARVRARMSTAARISARTDGSVENPGDLSADAALLREARMSPAARAAP